MRRIFIQVRSHLNFLSIILLSSILLIACANDQDATNESSDSTADKRDDPGLKGTSAAQPVKPDPYDMNDSTVTRLALLKREANTYRHGNQFILELPNSTNTDTLLKRDFGLWYIIRDTTTPRKLNPRNQDRLRNKVYGYLIYHDMVIKYPAAPHTIFFQWYGNGANVDSVYVWIHPAPVFKQDTSVSTLTLISDPPRPKVPPPPPME